jgi:plasmid stability protein
MAKMIQIRHVPDDIHRKLKARAALAGMSLSDYLLAEVRRSLDRPTMDELLARIARRSAVRLTESPADAVRAERDAG